MNVANEDLDSQGLFEPNPLGWCDLEANSQLILVGVRPIQK